MFSEQAVPMEAGPRLRRALGLWDLILYGMIVIQLTAPMPVYGVMSQRARGHAVTTVLIAMVAMLFTAIGYGRMARAYPSAGSAFTYVGSEIHPALGYVTGWSMAMDYMLNPIVCTILCSKFALNFLPKIPYAVWVVFFVTLFTGLNLFGIRTSARIGFDGISTLSEEAENPKRNILLATVLVCLITGVLASIEVYAAQLVWPSSQSFPDVDTAYVYVAGRAAGRWLFTLINITLLVATIGSGMGSQLGAARLLYGMGRGNALPKSFFGVIEPTRRIPQNNVIFVGLFALAGTTVLTFERAAELLNFGALLAFMGVNAASFARYYWRARQRTLASLFVPILGFTICLLLWLNLSKPAKIAGIIWMLLGIGYGAFRTRGFRSELVSFEVPEETEARAGVITT